MARQVHTVIDAVGPYPVGQPGAGTATLTWVAGHAVNKEEVALDYPIMVFCWNTDAVNPYTVTFDIVAGSGIQPITGYTLQAGDIAGFEFKPHNWKQSNGCLTFETNNAAVTFAVLKKG